VPARKAPPRATRKIITFDSETWNALSALVRDGMYLQELADDAFRDLLKKHGRPVTLKEALRQSARQEPANDRGRRARR
jgi:hypothetical protein